MASSSAFELLSQRFASRCSLSVKLARRHASTSSEGAAAAVATATSTEISRNVEFLRMELAKRRNVQRIWKRLNILNDLSPSSIPQDLLAASIPILLKSYDKRLAVQQRGTLPQAGQERYIKIQEEAETLYARYRFICNYLENNGWKPLSPKSAFGWAKAFEELGYAPAAWRIWEDRKRLADLNGNEGTKKGEDGLKYLADSVLVASLRYLKLRMGAVDQQGIRIQVRSHRQVAHDWQTSYLISRRFVCFRCKKLHYRYWSTYTKQTNTTAFLGHYRSALYVGGAISHTLKVPYPSSLASISLFPLNLLLYHSLRLLLCPTRLLQLAFRL